MSDGFSVERIIVAASKAESEGFKNTAAALKDLAKLWVDLDLEKTPAEAEISF